MQLLIALSLVLAWAVWRGGVNHTRLMRSLMGTLEAHFPQAEHDYVRLTSSGVGFEFSPPLPEGITSLRGTLTVLPRYSPLYVPLARALGRRDLMRITFLVEAMPLGIGTLRRATNTPILFDTTNDDPDLDQCQVDVGDASFTIFCYNPAVRRRLESLADLVAPCKEIIQIHYTHEDSSITCFLIPEPENLKNILSTTIDSVFFLTSE